MSDSPSLIGEHNSMSWLINSFSTFFLIMILLIYISNYTPTNKKKHFFSGFCCIKSKLHKAQIQSQQIFSMVRNKIWRQWFQRIQQQRIDSGSIFDKCYVIICCVKSHFAPPYLLMCHHHDITMKLLGNCHGSI